MPLFTSPARVQYRQLAQHLHWQIARWVPHLCMLRSLQVSGGPLPVRLACPSRPAISGRTVPQRYFCNSKYLEIDMDVSKDAIASRAISIAKPVSKSLTVDMAFVLEGQHEDELPEVALGAARFYHLDISDTAVPML